MENIPIKHFLAGCGTDVKETTLDPSENSFLLIANGIDQCNYIGKIRKDLGYKIIASQIQDNKSIKGLFNFRQSSSIQKILATIDDATSDDTQLFYNTRVETTVDSSSASGQKVLNVTSTTGFTAGERVLIGEDTASEEIGTIDTIQAGISLTLLSNLTNTQAVGKTVKHEWTEITGAETIWANKADIDIEMEQFIGYCFFVGYGSTDGFLPVMSLTGTTVSTTDQVTNMPQGKFIKRYGSRLYVANCYSGSTAYPYRVYFSDTPEAGNLSWGGEYFDVDFGEEITGLAENFGYLIIFTEFAGYFYTDTPSFRKIFEIGCSNHESIQNLGKNIIWADKDNIWMSYQGSEPNPIGEPIKQLLQNSDHTKHTSSVIDKEYHLYVGDTEANGITYNNCELIYNPFRKLWRWRCYADEMTKFARYTTGGDDYLIMGTNDGEVMKKSKILDSTVYYSDNGSAIKAEFRTKAMDFGDSKVSKILEEINVFCLYGQNLMVRARIFNNKTEVDNPFIDLKELNDFETIINGKKSNSDDDIEINGKFIQFEFTEESTNQAFEFLDLIIGITISAT